MYDRSMCWEWDCHSARQKAPRQPLTRKSEKEHQYGALYLLFLICAVRAVQYSSYKESTPNTRYSFHCGQRHFFFLFILSDVVRCSA